MLIVLASRFSLILAKGMSALQPSPYFGLIQTWSVVSGTEVYPIIRTCCSVAPVVDHVGVAGHGEGGGVLARLLHQEGVGEVRRHAEHSVQVLAGPLRDVHTSARFKVTAKGVNKTVL